METIAELFSLTGNGAIVTGGAMGIGQAISFRLCEAGAGVTIADVNMEAAKKTVEEIKKRGGKAQAIEADARSAADAKKVAQDTVDAFGRLDILVNNAGIYPLLPVRQVKEDLWDQVIDINLKGSFLYAQAAAEVMIQAGEGGRIINLASVDGLHPNGNATHYNASKGGVIMLTKALALELAPYQIRVNTVAPGSIETPGVQSWAAKAISDGLTREELGKSFHGRVPLGRQGKPDEIARAVLFLACKASEYMTGSLMLVDGGYLLS